MGFFVARHGSGSSGGGGGGSLPAFLSSVSSFPTWTKVAKGTGTGFDSGQKLGQIVQSPNSSDPPGGVGIGSRYGVFDGYTGSAIDPYNQEMLVIAGGGHGDGANNAGFALALGVDVPYWRRLNDCTPDANLGDLHGTGTVSGTFDDGRPRAMHGSDQVWAGTSASDSRIWFPTQSAVTSDGGGNVGKIWSYNRGALGAASSPLAWTSSDLGPWTFHGASNDTFLNTSFGTSVFDAANNQIIHIGNPMGGAGINWTKFTPGSGAITDTFYTTSSANIQLCSMAVICADLGIVVCLGDARASYIGVLDIAANTWAAPSYSGTPYQNQTTGGYIGMVYIPENHTILVADPHQTDQTYYKLTIPMTGSSYNPSGTWTITSHTWSGGPVIPDDYGRPEPSNYVSGKLTRHTYSDGTGLLILATNIDGPTFVSKIPAGGI